MHTAVLSMASKRTRRRSSTCVETPLIASLSDAKSEGKIKIDLSLETLLNAEWQIRRVACTKSKLYFMLPNDELIRDRIPLDEISAVDFMGEANTHGDHPNFRRRFQKEMSRCGSKDLNILFPELEQDNHMFMGLNAFQIRTIPNGFNSGRIYYLQAESKEAGDEVIEKLRKLISKAKARTKDASRFASSQEAARYIFESILFQTISALLIIVNFGSSIAQTQIYDVSNSDSDHEAAFYELDLFLTVSFTIELLLNAYANWFRPFITNAWSLFDFLIVSLSLISLMAEGMPLRLILLLRCCRVLRIFGKIPSVAKIFAALFQSLVPMINAFFIIFIIAAIYSIVGVTFLSEAAPAYFGSFSRAFVAMFRITIGSLDWWFDVFSTARSENSAQLFFLISYVILVNWVFFQVSIAVLLDNFLSASEAMKAEEYKLMIKEKQIEKHFKNPLDPLILRLSKDYINDADLSARLEELFKVLDSDCSGDLSSQEFQAAIKKLDISPRIFVSDSDFIAITKNGALCNARGHLGAKEFANVMREQIRLYTQQRLSSSSEFWAVSDEDFTELASMKQILNELLGARAEQERTSQRLEEVLFMLHSKERTSSQNERDSNHHDSYHTDNFGTRRRGSFNHFQVESSEGYIQVETSEEISDQKLHILRSFATYEHEHDNDDIASTTISEDQLHVDISEDQLLVDCMTEAVVLKSLPDLNSFVSESSEPHIPVILQDLPRCTAPFPCNEPQQLKNDDPTRLDGDNDEYQCTLDGHYCTYDTSEPQLSQEACIDQAGNEPTMKRTSNELLQFLRDSPSGDALLLKRSLNGDVELNLDGVLLLKSGAHSDFAGGNSPAHFICHDTVENVKWRSNREPDCPENYLAAVEPEENFVLYANCIGRCEQLSKMKTIQALARPTGLEGSAIAKNS